MTPAAAVPALLLVATLLTGCGDGAEPTAAAPSPTSSSPEPTMAWSSGPPAPPHGLDVVDSPVATGLHPPMTPEDYRAMRTSNRAPRRGRILLIAALLAALVAAGTGWWYADGRYDSAPALVGTSEKDATTQADRAGYTLKVGERRFSEDVAAGVVMSTSPSAGDKILGGDTITAVVSKGKDRVLLPKKIEGMSVDDFRAALSKVDLVPGEASAKYSEDVKKGLLIAPVSVEADQQLKRGTEIDYYVSRGRKPIAIRDYAGANGEAAQRALAKAGFKVAVDERYSDDVARGDVISQSPDDGNGYKDDLVTLVVSRGTDKVTVPNLLGGTRLEARAALAKAKLKGRAYGPPNFRVLNQYPEPGTKVKRGSVVTVSPLP